MPAAAEAMTTAERYGVWLGVAGFVISLINLAWTIWTWWDQNRVKLHANVRLGRDHRGKLLIATLVNDGSKPEFIEQVTLVGARIMKGALSPPSLILTPELLPEGPRTRPARAETAREAGGPRIPLEARDARTYVLARHPSLTQQMGDIRNARQYDYWISVRTPKGEVMKVNDRAFLDTLKSFAEDDDFPFPVTL